MNHTDTDTEQEGLPFDVPDVQTFGEVYRLTVHTDSRGAVIVAYTRDGETGAVTRSQLRVDLAASAYIRRRLAGA